MLKPILLQFNDLLARNRVSSSLFFFEKLALYPIMIKITR
jgi:hypothetical protein